jgi:hypothetical protein
MTLPPDLDFALDRSASPDRMNRATSNIDGRLKVLESYKPNFDAQLAVIQQVGLNRLSQVLVPIYEQIAAIAHLGAIFTAHSASTVAVGSGQKTWVIDESSRAPFAPAAWVVATTTGDAAAMAGPLVSYDAASGALVVDVAEAYGAGSYGSWTISAGGPTQLASADDGCIDDPPAAKPVFEGYLAPEVIAGLQAYIDAMIGDRVRSYMLSLPDTAPANPGDLFFKGGVLQKELGP